MIESLYFKYSEGNLQLQITNGTIPKWMKIKHEGQYIEALFGQHTKIGVPIEFEITIKDPLLNLQSKAMKFRIDNFQSISNEDFYLRSIFVFSTILFTLLVFVVIMSVTNNNKLRSIQEKSFQAKEIVDDGKVVESQVLTDSILNWKKGNSDDESTGKGDTFFKINFNEEQR